MATFLYRLGRSAFRRRWLVTVAWFGVLAATVLAAVALAKPASGTFEIPGTPAQQAIDLLGERFPAVSAGGASARVVFAAPEGRTLAEPEYRAAVERAITDIGGAPQVASVTDPFQTGAVDPTTGTIGYAQATYSVSSALVTEEARDALMTAIEQARTSGLTVEAGGDALQAPVETGVAEVLGIAVAAVVLVVTFGSLVAAGLPLLTALLGIGIGVGLVTAAGHFFDLSSYTPVLALMLGLAVAIDYALFIVSRYRHEVALGRAPEEAAGRAVGTAGSAVVFAGLTVVIALAGLAVIGIPFLSQMGLAAAGTVAISVLLALTLLPALLGFAGHRLLGRRARAAQAAGPDQAAGADPAGERAKAPMGERWVAAIARRPVTVLLTCLVALGVIAIPALDLRLGMPSEAVASPDSTQRKAYDLLAGGFGPGVNGPLTVVVDTGGESVTAAAEQAAQRIGGLPDVLAVVPVATNPEGNTSILTVVPASAPNAAETQDLVRAIRALDGTIPGAGIGVTGLTAVNIDISTKLDAALVPYVAVVVGLAFILLMLVFRSLLVPLKATAGFLLSIAATLGAVVAVFQWGWLAGVFGVEQPAPIISFLPIFLVGIVFGLAMDYQVFLVTRMREEHVHGRDARTAVTVGFAHGARVVTAAALIMISVFAGFVFSPESFIKSIGFGLAIAVFFDAIVVRMVVVPALMTLFGRAAWWLPRWLDRVLPDVDVEGEKLVQHLDHGDAGSAPEAEKVLR
ncbi:MMPL family transporter [Actinokineospora spheciospongiae]|uniref:MMPL family transporter n=1 Tax=Actinokineospora spheciospongiae TaxID=909613 RepID=UPI000D709325|nr:MMPL family transporter [Actinokineospora spheciospongiae]PWW66781.1 RND superfamily putative drug exporter [Actinokineospora spheciospongiae]